MPGERDDNQASSKDAGQRKKFLHLFRFKSRRREQLKRDMKNNWDELPATLRRKKEKLCPAVLAEFQEDEQQIDQASEERKQEGDAAEKEEDYKKEDKDDVYKQDDETEDLDKQDEDGDLGKEERHVIQLLSRAVSEDSLLIVSSSSDANMSSSSSVASGDERTARRVSEDSGIASSNFPDDSPSYVSFTKRSRSSGDEQSLYEEVYNIPRVELQRDSPYYFTLETPIGSSKIRSVGRKPKIMDTIVEETEEEKLSVRELLKKFEELGGRMVPQQGEERSATLKEIQETLRCLEEKVRQYENKLDDDSEDEKLQQKNVVVQNRVSQTQMNKSLPPVIDNWTGGGAVVNSHHHHLNGPPPSSLPAVLQPHSLSESVGESPGQHDGKHSLLQFAMLHFRQSPEKFEMLKTADGSISGSLKVIESLKNKKNKGKKGNKENEWTWREQVAMVKFTPVPIEQSLLRMESNELNELAVECFVSVMRYMGDLPMPPDVTEVKCVYTILMHCHKHESLRDEVYCQLMKQTTNNKSNKPDSCQRGWRLFSIVAAYFICSDVLKPYLFKYLETAAYDKRRAYHGTAMVCLQNLRKTFKYGGRKNVPSVEEITAVSAGRNAKRQIYRLPGGTERVINTKSTTVVQDIIEEMCAMINVKSQHETEEFSLYCIVEGDTFTMPLAREEYILDVTTELHKNQQVFYLIFCRSVWHFPLRLESRLYIEVVFNQIAPDYLEGLLLVLPGEQLEQDVIYDIAKMASLLHRAADMTHVPGMKETKFLLPKPALAVRDVKPAQWVNMVQSNWREVEGLQTVQAKAQVLDILSKWPLFGSSFFAVKLVSDPKERNEHILALNRHGVHFLDLVTHETLIHYSYSEVISTRKVKSEDGTLFLDMKCGNLMQQRITRLQTDQAHEISRLIRQYITMEQRLRTS